MTTLDTPALHPASPPELALWSVLVLVAGAVPGLGLAVGIVLALTRLRENRVARVLVPVLGAVATALWALGLVATGADGGAGLVMPVR